MDTADVIRAIRETGIIQRPLVALVAAGQVSEVLHGDQVGAAAIAAQFMAARTAKTIGVWEIDERLPAPEIGTTVPDPATLGWVENYRVLWALPIDAPTWVVFRKPTHAESA
jgi:hypothetical protein